MGCSTTSSPSLTGVVTSDGKELMEGVLVTAKLSGGKTSITVVSDAGGSYSFPPGRLGPGNYVLSVRAAGYELAAPVNVELRPGQTVKQDLLLRRTENLASQLTGAEWLISVPGTEAEKSELYRCESCHTLETVMRSHHGAADWAEVLTRMQGYLAPSTQEFPLSSHVAAKSAPRDAKTFGAYLASINLNRRTQWPFGLRSFPRPQGKNGKVTITEYDLPRANSFPHDAVVAKDGRIWYNDFQQPFIGVLDPKTGQTREWKLPVLRSGDPAGFLTIKLDAQGNAWLPRFMQGCTVTRFDPRAETFTSWTVDPQYNDARSRCAHVALGAPDGTVWFSDSENRRMFRLNPASGQIDAYNSFPEYSGQTGAVTDFHNTSQHRTYGIAVDSTGNGYFADIAGGNIGRVDAKTGKVTLYPTPTPNSGPRRTFMDAQDRLWFGENYASKLGMLDTHTGKIQEWTPPIPWAGCYPAVVDRNGDVWTVGMSTDYIYRFHPATAEFTYYLLPTLGANLRKIDVDNSTTPVTIWVAEVHRGKLARIEPQD
jgi:virginiamycin B lyase